ncbi:helix-turn-helix domain-containing protein [Nonomuraea sp. 3-1Str]|uniref:helix-turn-helix domain-containing protein n=1 Tax=Nonomuraea sp. 3-1Str TaxID=2929801 RepID=UPI002870620A|nr:helix-turn-helix domain-containing protein [Nonomuraea sp. 3-1Str]
MTVGPQGPARRLGWILIIGSLATGALGMVAEPILSSLLLAKSYPFHLQGGDVLAGIVTGMRCWGVSEIVRRGNGHAKAMRFSTLMRLCDALDCQPGDLLSYERS